MYLPVFQYIAAVDFVPQFVQTSNAKQVMLNSSEHSLKRNLSHQLLLGDAILYVETEKHEIHVCVQNKTVLKFPKIHGNWFRHFEDISRRCEVVSC